MPMPRAMSTASSSKGTISPAWTVNDGDVTFALSCGDKVCDITALGAAAAEAAANAIVRAVQLAPTVGTIPGLAG